jgi:MarR family transcriptional regulator for hemolysin
MYPPDEHDPLTRRLVFLSKQIRSYFQASLAEHGATIPTWSILDCAHRMPGLSQVQMAGKIGVEGPSLVRQLDKLSAEGLIERRRDERDRRIVRLELTDLGQQRWTELKEVSAAMDDFATGHLSDDQRAALSAAIDSIHEALEEAHVPVNTAG